MSRLEFLVRAAGVIAASLAVAGCTSAQQMTPQQREGVELRRFCERNPEEVVKCIGFLGWR